MLEVALGRLLGVVARMEGMSVRHVRVVSGLLVRPGLMVLRRFLVMVSGVLEVFSRLLMMFSRLFGHGIPPVSGELPSLIGSKSSLTLSGHPGPAPLDVGLTPSYRKSRITRDHTWDRESGLSRKTTADMARLARGSSLGTCLVPTYTATTATWWASSQPATLTQA